MLVVLATRIARQLCRLAGGTTGSTTRSIAAELRTAIARRQTDSEAQPAVIHSRTAKRMRGSSLAVKAAIWVARAIAELVQATAPVVGLATGLVRVVLETEPAEQIASEVGTSREAAAEAETHSVGGPEGTADLALVPAAAAVLRAWDLEEAASAGAEADVGGSGTRIRAEFHRSTE